MAGLLLIGAPQWLAGTWKTSSPAAGDYITDVNGVTITVGATVKFVGKVTAINANDSHFGDIQVVGINPSGLQVVPDSSFGSPQSSNFAVPNPLDKKKPYGFHPLQLVVGS